MRRVRDLIQEPCVADIRRHQRYAGLLQKLRAVWARNVPVHLMTASRSQVQRLAYFHLQQAVFGTATLHLNCKGLRLRYRDRITLSVASLGWQNKICRVESWRFEPLGGVVVTVREDAASANLVSPGPGKLVMSYYSDVAYWTGLVKPRHFAEFRYKASESDIYLAEIEVPKTSLPVA